MPAVSKASTPLASKPPLIRSPADDNSKLMLSLGSNWGKPPMAIDCKVSPAFPPRSTVRLSPVTLTASMLSFCSSLRDVAKWVPSPASTRTWVASSAKAKVPSGRTLGARALACASLICRPSAEPLLTFAVLRALSRAKISKSPSALLVSPVVPSASTLIWSMPVLAK